MLKRIVIALSLLCYLMACIFTPFYYSNMPTEDYFFGSMYCLLLGWAGILFHEGFLKIYFLAWYSNITYFFAIRSLIKDKYKRFLIWSSITFVFALLFAFCHEVVIDEAGHTQMITMAVGYYLWVTSFFVLLIGGIVLFKKNSKKGKDLIKKVYLRNRFCKICGYELAYSPWGENNDTPTYEICPCCGAEFGCDDYTPESIKAYREKWIKSGAKWFNSDMMPDNWNLEKQLHNCINIEINNKLSNNDLTIMSNWKSKQQIFFLTKLDIINMMSIVEKKIPIEYVLMGAFDSEVVRRESTISKFTKLGQTDYGNWISLDNRYMVLPLNDEVKYRTVKQRDGSYHYIIDLSSNPTGVELSTGGGYNKVEQVLIAGRIAVFTDSSSESMLIYKEILKAMNKCFAKKNNIFISQKALSLLEDGWRLTCNFNASCENDFK